VTSRADHAYKRYGTVSLLAASIYSPAKFTLSSRTATSREFIEFSSSSMRLRTHTAIKLILDNHSAHISKETKVWLAIIRSAASNSPSHQARLLAQSREGFFSKLPLGAAHIRVESKELKDRIMAPWMNSMHPVVHIGPIS